MARLSRRDLLQVSALGGMGAILAACGAPAATPTTAPAPTKPAATAAPAATSAPAATTAPTAAATAKPAATTAPAASPSAAATTKPQVEMADAWTKSPVVKTIPTKFSESPMLAERVKAGKLPAVEKRLPENPLVLQPYEEVGTYGGTIRTGDTGTSITGTDCQLATGADTQLWLRISADLQSWEPNLASDCKVSDDKTTFTLSVRKGLKWSDGEPFTSKDLMFLYEDILLNKELNPVVPARINPEGKLMEASAPDDYTFVLKHQIPQPAFLMFALAHRTGFNYKNIPYAPLHYLKQFHIKYNPKAIDEAKAAKYDGWFQRFADVANYALNKDLPVMAAMVPVEVTPTLTRFERNPYFWQVDTAGNQLPYVDGAVMERAANLEVYNSKIVTGAYDFAGFSCQILNYEAYANGAKAGNYRVVLWNSGKGAEVVYQVNQTIKDPDLQPLHRDVRYRRALSLAINREEINNLIYFGKAIPRQITAIRQSKYFKPEYEKAWAQFDVAQANKLLDEIGLKWNADKTVRLLPSGKPLQVNWDFVDSETPKGPITELVTEYWRKIGLQIQVKSITRQLIGPRVIANEEPMFLWHGDSCSDILLPADRRWFTGKGGDDSSIWPTWSQWYDSKGKQGEEPPQEIKDGFNTFDDFVRTLDPKYADKILSNQAEKLISIGTVGMAPHPLIIRSNMKNVVPNGAWVWDDLWTWPYHSELWFFKK